MGLDLNILELDKLSGRGRRPKPIEFEVVRELNEADLALMGENAGIQPIEIKRITDRHHGLARLLATGTPEGEAALIMDYDPARVSILKQSPAFQELLAFYSKEQKDKFSTVLDHMAGLSRDALLELRTRLEESPERFSVLDLTRLVTEMADRTTGQDEKSVDLPDLIELVSPEPKVANDEES